MRKTLKITAIVVGLLVLVLAATLGILYLLYPVQFIEAVRYWSNPYEKTDVVASQEPETSTSDFRVLAASAVGLAASPLGTGSLAALPDLVTKSPSQPLPQSIMVEVMLPFTEKEQRRVFIYLPKGYQPGSTDVRYPTLYFLHGTPGTEIDWPQKGGAKGSLDEAIEKKIIPPVIAAFPNGNGGILDDSEYINSPDGLQPNEDFIVKKVVSYIDQKYPTLADSKYRAITGLSEGGYAAVNLSLRNQDVFGCAFSLSGYGNIDQNRHSAKVIQGSAKTIHDNSPLQYIPELKTRKTKILIIIGREDGLYKENEEIYKLLEKNKFAVEFQVYPGRHTWTFWSPHLKDGIAWWGKQMPAH